MTLIIASVWKRLHYDEWAGIVPHIAFTLTALGFIYLTIRAIRMKKTTRDHLANLPLEDEQPKHPSRKSASGPQ